MNKTQSIAMVSTIVLLIIAFSFTISFILTRSGENVPIGENVTLYFYRESADRGPDGNILYSPDAVLPVRRTLSDVSDEGILRALLQGTTESEEKEGYSSEFPLPGVQLVSAVRDGSVLTVTLLDPHLKTSGGSCRAGILRAQVEKTAFSILGVESVVIKPEELFQP
jgi:hypothetical protein